MAGKRQPKLTVLAPGSRNRIKAGMPGNPYFARCHHPGSPHMDLKFIVSGLAECVAFIELDMHAVGRQNHSGNIRRMAEQSGSANLIFGKLELPGTKETPVDIRIQVLQANMYA